jgi:dUTP pyrophosphatase
MTEEWNKHMEIKIKYFTDDLEPLCYVDGKSDWIDLQSSETVEMDAGDYRLIPLGVAMELPTGYEAHIVPRSSTFKRYGLLQTNSTGIVDNSYSGDGDQWYFSAYATRKTVVEKGTRLCQFRIFENQPKLSFTKVDHLDGKNRGGFGSTGK